MIEQDGIITQVEDIGWDAMLAERTQRMSSSVIRELLKFTQQPDIISFAGGLPAPEFFPIREFKEACHYVLENEGTVALQYSPTEGYWPLKEYLAETMSKYGILVEPENILMVSGSQQGLDLLGKLFIDRDACIICSRPTYLGALQAWNAYEVRYESVPLDDEGMVVEDILPIIEAGNRPRFVYVLPNFHNPAGTTLSAERRERLVEIARQYDLVIIEDDPYGQLRYEGEHLPPVVVMDDELRSNKVPAYRGNVIYTSTFSKILAPGLRLAWVIAPVEVIEKLVQVKQGADLHTSTFTQYIAYEVIREPSWMKNHIQMIRKVYRERRDVMLKALEEFMPDGTRWTHPKGGLFLWVSLPKGYDTNKIFPKAIEQKVAYVPGTAFHPNGGGENTMRLNFSYSKPEIIYEGIQRLAKVVKQNPLVI